MRYRAGIISNCSLREMFLFRETGMEIPELLHRMDQAVVKHRKGDLLLGWRLRLWSLMKHRFGKEADYRRNVLAFLAAQDVYRLWEEGTLVSAIPPEDLDEYYALPGQAMDEYVRFLKGRSSRKKLKAIMEALETNLDYWEGNPHDQMQGAYIIIQHAGSQLLGIDDLMYEDRGWYERIWDGAEHLKITDDSLGEPAFCDAHYFAAMVATNDSNNKVAARRAFWRRWLTETVPSVLVPLPGVRALLQTWKGSGAPPLGKTFGQAPEFPIADAKEALRQHLQALALPAGEQRKLYGIGCQICGLTGTVEIWSKNRLMAPFVTKQDARRRKKLWRIQQLAASIAEDRAVGCYDYQFTRTDDRWKEMRNLARELLDDYGWRRGRPPKRGNLLFGTPAC